MTHSNFKIGDIVKFRSMIYLLKSLDELEINPNNFILSAFFALSTRRNGQGELHPDYVRKFPIRKWDVEKGYFRLSTKKEKELLLSRIKKEQPAFDLDKIENDNAMKYLSEINKKMDKIITLLATDK